MKLLIVTQKIDKHDPVLGFFHRWVEEFAKHCESIIVVCLQKGEYDLPDNVRVLSLGKEEGRSRLKYIVRFYKYIWRERKNYDAVFVHMNPEYVVLGGLFWRLWGKKVGLWYNHTYGNITAFATAHIATVLFHTSLHAYTAKFEKANQMPVGIDITRFTYLDNIQRHERTILYVGRMSLIKKVDVIIRAAHILHEKGISFFLGLYGEPGEKDGVYFKELRDDANALVNIGKVKFFGGIANVRLPAIYNQYFCSVNLTPPGNFDKTIFEAMAAGTLVLATNPSLKEMLGDLLFLEADTPEVLAERIESLWHIKERDVQLVRDRLRRYVVQEHSLHLLVKKVLERMV